MAKPHTQVPWGLVVNWDPSYKSGPYYAHGTRQQGWWGTALVGMQLFLLSSLCGMATVQSTAELATSHLEHCHTREQCKDHGPFWER